MHGFGPVPREADGPVFHEAWEKRAFVAHIGSIARGVVGPIDANRHAMERMGNVEYLSTSYYEHWLAGTRTLLIENGVITEEELRARTEAVRKDPERFALPPSAGPDEFSQALAGMIEHGGSTLRETGRQPSFEIGDEVRTTTRSPRGHTRLPRYARGRRGRIVSYHGAHVLPDTNAHGLGECPEPLYTVRFEAAELWGAEGLRDAVHLELWESYLAPATGAR
jgi:nitrile hydratase